MFLLSSRSKNHNVKGRTLSWSNSIINIANKKIAHKTNKNIHQMLIFFVWLIKVDNIYKLGFQMKEDTCDICFAIHVFYIKVWFEFHQRKKTTRFFLLYIFFRWEKDEHRLLFFLHLLYPTINWVYYARTPYYISNFRFVIHETVSLQTNFPYFTWLYFDLCFILLQ